MENSLKPITKNTKDSIRIAIIAPSIASCSRSLRPLATKIKHLDGPVTCFFFFVLAGIQKKTLSGFFCSDDTANAGSSYSVVHALHNARPYKEHPGFITQLGTFGTFLNRKHRYISADKARDCINNLTTLIRYSGRENAQNTKTINDPRRCSVK